MVDKFSRSNLLVDHEDNSHEEQELAPIIYRSEDSAHILLKQALHSDDIELLLDCLYNQDEKIFANSTSLLDPSDVPKLLDTLVSFIQTRHCVGPKIFSTYPQLSIKLFESRSSACQQDLPLSSCLDHLYAELEIMDGLDVNHLNEPTMGGQNLHVDDEAKIHEKQQSYQCMEPQTIGTVHILEQALRADNSTLLLDCLNIQDEKVISNLTSLLSTSDVLKLLDSLVYLIQSSQDAVLVCSFPWLRSLLLQHADVIMSHESSLLALNSLYQVSNDLADERSIVEPVQYEDKDDGDDKEPEDALDA